MDSNSGTSNSGSKHLSDDEKEKLSGLLSLLRDDETEKLTELLSVFHDDEKEKLVNLLLRSVERKKLAEQLLQNLKNKFEIYINIIRQYKKRHYWIVGLFVLLILLGIVALLLKIYEKENLTSALKVVESSFASVLSGGGIFTALASIFSRHPEEKNDPDFTPETVSLCEARNLWEKLKETADKLEGKSNSLGTVKIRQAVWTILGSIAILVIVVKDFFEIISDGDVGILLDIFFIISGVYGFITNCLIYIFVTWEREEIERNRVFWLFSPLAFCAGLCRLSLRQVLPYLQGKGGEHWIKDISLPEREKMEVLYLLSGLDPVNYEKDFLVTVLEREKNVVTVLEGKEPNNTS